jgi:small redox-active disulfide protein 2
MIIELCFAGIVLFTKNYKMVSIQQVFKGELQMKKKDEIWIIGTEPPCPRCNHLNRMIHGLVSELGLSIFVRHLAYTEAAALELAEKVGLEPGTAKDVAKKGAIDMDWQRISKLVEVPSETAVEKSDGVCCPAIAEWTSELDEMLRPCENEALKLGIMMTPVLVLSGRIQHQGSVPPREQIKTWLEETYEKSDERIANQIFIEVLGPGCVNCEKVYQNAFQAVERLGLNNQVTIVKVTDIQEFAKKGIHVTPCLVINDRIVSKGKVLGVDQIMQFLNETNEETFGDQ